MHTSLMTNTPPLSDRITAALPPVLAKRFRATAIVNGVELECMACGANDIRELMADAKRALERHVMSAIGFGCSLYVQ